MPEYPANMNENPAIGWKAWYENDSNLDILREIPRFKEMLNSI